MERLNNQIYSKKAITVT